MIDPWLATGRAAPARFTLACLLMFSAVACPGPSTPPPVQATRPPGDTAPPPGDTSRPPGGDTAAEVAPVPSGMHLRVTPEVSPGEAALRFVVTNHTAGAWRVPNGKSTASYSDRPFGLELELVGPGGPCQDDPRAGGPAFPIGDEHFTDLAPGASLERRVDLASWISGGKRVLQQPGTYRLKARWARLHGEAPFDRSSLARPNLGDDAQTATPPPPPPRLPLWTGATNQVEASFEVR